MRLFIAEKHEVALAIANALGRAVKKTGHYACGDDLITWCAGHMLALCSPEDYNQAHKKWTLASLPIINIPWKYRVIEGRAKQFGIIQALIKRAHIIVNAGDADAEGQLLIDEILTYCGNKKPVKRILINDNNEKLVQRALHNLRDNRDFYGLYQAALARAVGDQLYGFNLTRLYTLKGRERGHDGLLSVGRVQTPILGLIAARDSAIAAHKKAFYYTVKGQFTVTNIHFPALFCPPADAPLDDKGRIESADYARQIADACRGQPASVVKAETKDKYDPAPLPYDLLELQVDASRKFSIKADLTLQITQQLREKKLITYNRSDCRYLNDENHRDATDVLTAVATNAPLFAPFIAKADTEYKSRAFNNAKVTAHHAIVPTQNSSGLNTLNDHQRKIYLLICRAYIAQFWPLKHSKVTMVNIDVAGHRFRTTNTQVIKPGWSTLYKNDKGNQEIAKLENTDVTSASLSQLHNSAQGHCTACESEKKETIPPQPYTEASLLKDLKRVAKYVKNPKIAKLLRDKDKGKEGESGGIGTPATRDSFIVKLKQRGFIAEQGKHLVCTKLGREFCAILPPIATAPDLTALWHQQQKDIEQGKIPLRTFLEGLVSTVSAQVAEVKEKGLNIKLQGFNCSSCNQSTLRRIKGKKGYFWACRRHPECNASFADKAGKPDFAPQPQATASDSSNHTCPECKKGRLIKRASKSKKTKKTFNWFGCNQFPACKARFFERDGKPENTVVV
ncbi:MAG: DNA topoisomerase 3 [Gammaproteobacteria bacterium]|nr:DNA topoisomerase 3 [Gammaproteobacteria bacterium]